MRKRVIYLDYQSTTKVDPRILKNIYKYFDTFANPNSEHYYGWGATEVVETAKESIAKLVNAPHKEVLFTSGATESNKMVLNAEFLSKINHDKKRRHIITVCTEHSSVLNPCTMLEKHGYKVTYLPVSQNGLIDLNRLEDSITNDTFLISIMAVNNEIGVIQPTETIGAICKQHSLIFHSDATQALGKTKLDIQAINIDIISGSGHKIYAPTGIGMLYINERIMPLKEQNILRQGTTPTALVAALGFASEILMKDSANDNKRIAQLQTNLMDNLQSSIPDLILNGDAIMRVKGNINLCFPTIKDHNIITRIPGLAISTGSACNIGKPSYVLESLGLNAEMVKRSVRIGIGRFSTLEEINTASQMIIDAVIKDKKSKRLIISYSEL